MKKIILLTAMLIFLSCCAKESPSAYQWVCLEPSSAFDDERKIKPEDAVYITENADDEYWINFMIRDKIDFKSSPLGWKVYPKCVKVTWKDGRRTSQGIFLEGRP